MPRPLGGTNGIPGYDERTYVRVTSVTEADGHTMPLEIHWGDGRRFPVVSSTLVRTVGRWEYGTVIRCWEVELRMRARHMLYWERGRWFVARGASDRNGERAVGEPA